MERKLPFPYSQLLLILSVLEEGDQHGYQIIQRLEAYADTTFFMQEGMLYPMLHYLEMEGELRSYMAKAPSGKPRRYYGLTKQGVHFLTQARQGKNAFCFGKSLGGEACAEHKD